MIMINTTTTTTNNNNKPPCRDRPMTLVYIIIQG